MTQSCKNAPLYSIGYAMLEKLSEGDDSFKAIKSICWSLNAQKLSHKHSGSGQ